jgi:hypothetical protein
MSGASNLMKRSLSSVVTLIVGVLVLFSIPDQIVLFDEGQSSANARTVPYLITSLIILISLVMIVSEVIATQDQSAEATDGEPHESVRYGRVILAFAAIALWIVILPYLGFNISTILLVATVMLIIGNCRWWQIILLPLILSFPINYLLAAVLRVYLPSGSVFS